MPHALVHGGGFDHRCRGPLVPLLDAPAFSVGLPGRGSRPADLDRVTVADFADAVAAEITEWDLTDVVLVGHSLAGITLPGVAGRVATGSATSCSSRARFPRTARRSRACSTR